MSKVLLTAGTVFLVMGVARHGGRRLAGLVAAWPTITAPTLAWLAHEEGVGFAIHAAIGSVAACSMLAAFALGYARAARHGGTALALAAGLAAALAMALPAAAVSLDLTCAAVLALASGAAAFAAMPRLGAVAPPRHGSWRSMLCVATAAAALTAVAASVGPALGGFATGLLASLPLITGSVAVAEHAAGGHRATVHFLRGYVAGLFGKVAFGAVFVLLAPRMGAAAALGLACGCAGLMSTIRVGRRAVSESHGATAGVAR